MLLQVHVNYAGFYVDLTHVFTLDYKQEDPQEEPGHDDSDDSDGSDLSSASIMGDDGYSAAGKGFMRYLCYTMHANQDTYDTQ